MPENCEGNNMIDFGERLIHEKLDVNSDLHMEWAHGAFGPSTGLSVVRIQSYNTKQRVLQAAEAKKIIWVNDRRIYSDEASVFNFNFTQLQ